MTTIRVKRAVDGRIAVVTYIGRTGKSEYFQNAADANTVAMNEAARQHGHVDLYLLHAKNGKPY